MFRFVLLCAIVISVFTSAQETTVKKTPVKYTSPTSGKEMYTAYCASCHGAEGRGNGPVAPALKSPPPDLTTMTRKNAGKFPFEQVLQTIKGDAHVPSHGSAEMPVWGPVFSQLAREHSGEAQQRISNLAKYVDTLQMK